MNLLPGRTLETKQELSPNVQERFTIAESKQSSGKKKLTLVCFIGGVTFSEISGLRFLKEKEALGRDFVVMTTKLVNGDTLLSPCVENLQNSLNLRTITDTH